ncbi:MAG: TerB family tellurite resistance protein [Bacteroidia bacterium]
MSIFQGSGDAAYQRKLSHLKNLIAIAFADRELKPNEIEFLHQVSSRLNISQEDVERIIEEPSSVEFHPPKKERERFLRLYALIAMMLADNDMDLREIEHCRQLAIKLGYKEDEASELITTISNAILTGTSVDKLYDKEDRKKFSEH